MATKHPVLICTVGTSLLIPNLERLKSQFKEGTISSDLKDLASAYISGSDENIVLELLCLQDSQAECGAEINSIASMGKKGYIEEKCNLYFLHSDTPDGYRVANILHDFYMTRDYTVIKVPIPDLQDTDPKRFRTKGLRNLAKEMCQIISERNPAACAINATGGYKAQIAIAVLIGQALEVPVYYKHERFPEIITFPPMPTALDFELWMKNSGIFYEIDQCKEPLRSDLFTEEWNEKLESLVDHVTINGVDFIDLSPIGQIFHETFKYKFKSNRDQVLPPPAISSTKRPPHLENAGWKGEHPEVKRFMQAVTDEISQVVQCSTFWYSPDLSERTRFRLGGKGIECIFSNGSYCVKFRVDTSAQTEGQQLAMVAVLNEWLRNR